ncbi:MAG: 3-deoxy-7-phosphoheptulonate synthase [Gemmatimonadetes bacterium]|jgi:3-deoxy-7-phosphoheptulonate synthase|nr:3-deoxy-7-phosphoheptulonate synthase [Gemmatimonadota bacterium]MBT6149628.1 3-deoxy-7-phosphoheptulonate synthase [Gemmatimonadota bacterium]MBT7861624.1 3-deoxy-7-phosphoheptulonate synthase [Gemmatimonadota bacterium]
MLQTQDVHVTETSPLISPRQLKDDLAMSDAASRTVIRSRARIGRILRGEDDRLLVISGPCSIHDPQAALEYATRLQALREELDDRLCLVMRVYFEKPRTTVGWKGLINDPRLDGSDDMSEGLRVARKLLLEITEMGLPVATEALDPITPQYVSDLISWSAIGARTTESQTHRELASGLSMPVGFKNSTFGDLQVAVDAIESSRSGHSFLGIDTEGRTSVIRTAGNPHGHLVMRGGANGPNYHAADLAAAAALLRAGTDKRPAIVVDCSHANSGKKHSHQEAVWDSVIQQRVDGNDTIVGLMVESHLEEGNQKIGDQGLTGLQYGVSVTDECVGWETTQRMLHGAYDALGPAEAKAA